MTRIGSKPWVENMILAYGTETQPRSERLRARVIGVGEMSRSQAQGAPRRHPELLFLSDGEVQMPALLTGSAWDHLCKKEERESYTSLMQAIVCLRTYSLQFHMSPEETRCRFFLSVSDLVSMSTGGKDSVPCYTTLDSVKLKIRQTWGAQRHLRNLDQCSQLTPDQYNQLSRHGFNLSGILGEWQRDCLAELLEDVRRRLTEGRMPVSPLSSTSSGDSPIRKHTSTGWDVFRVRYRGAEPFDVPAAHLVIPGEVTRGSEPRHVGGRSKTPNALVPQSDDSSPASLRRATRRGPGTSTHECPPPTFPYEAANVVARMMDEDYSTDPWNTFPSPGAEFSTSSSPELSPKSRVAAPRERLDPTVKFQAGCQAGAVTSTQRAPVRLGVTPTPGRSKKEQSFFPPYQKPQPTSISPSSASVSPADPAGTDTIPCGAGEKVPHIQSTTGKVKMNRSEGGDATTVPGKQKRARKEGGEDDRLDPSPPSWLFETQAKPGSERGEAPRPKASPPAVHRDGSRFSYTYRVSGQNLQDLSRFTVAEDLLHWAVKYLAVPQQTDTLGPIGVSSRTGGPHGQMGH